MDFFAKYFTLDLWWVLFSIIPGLAVLNFLDGKVKDRVRYASAILHSYCFLVLSYCVFSRTSGTVYKYELEPFWSYRLARFSMTYFVEITLNIFLFVPIGFLMSQISKFWKTVTFACLLSSVIEVLQLIAKRGLFEFDDIINNTLGAVIGCLLFYGLRNIVRTITKNRRIRFVFKRRRRKHHYHRGHSHSHHRAHHEYEKYLSHNTHNSHHHDV